MSSEGRGTGGKILSLATKRARRVQEKMLQKLGKSDQTKDEVFQDFVVNFNRQSATATKLQKELTRFMNAVRVLNQCTRSLSETLGDVYEPGWAGCDKYGDIMKTRMLLWEDLLISLQSKMMEPMGNYISKFPEIKARIHKRERKVVDYDLRRRELEALKNKQKATDQKIAQSEDSYSQAKQLYDEITDELYEELPTFFDSRIQFYASIFQSLAATEARFHSEVAKVDEEFAGLMDGLASEAATAIHTTKKERTLDSTPKLLSRPGEDSNSDTEEAFPSSPHEPSLATPENHSLNEESSNSNTSSTPTHPNHDNKQEKLPESASGSLRREPPSKPVRLSSSAGEEGEGSPPPPAIPPEAAAEQPPDSGDSGEQPLAAPTSQRPPLVHELSEADLAELDAVIETTSPVKEVKTPPSSPPTEPDKTEESKPDDEEQQLPVKEPDNALYKVIATHPYQGEDEDELAFEKGAVIAVIPYEDPDDEEEGWLNGVALTTGKKGIFPANFTKSFTD